MFNFSSFLNIPAVRIKPHKTNLEDLYNMFVIEEKQKLLFEKECVNILFNEGPEAFYEKTKGKNITLENYFLDYLITAFGEHDYKRCRAILEIINKENNGKVKSSRLENGKIVITTKNREIKTSRVSDFTSSLISGFPDLTKKENTSGQCHNFSIKFILNANFPCKIATGYVSSFSEETKYLHSWVEATLNNKNYVFDLTRNMFIEQKDYYNIQNITGPVYKISQTKFIQDRDLFNEIAQFNGPLAKLYLANRPQALFIYNKQKEQKAEIDYDKH